MQVEQFEMDFVSCGNIVGKCSDVYFMYQLWSNVGGY